MMNAITGCHLKWKIIFLQNVLGNLFVSLHYVLEACNERS